MRPAASKARTTSNGAAREAARLQIIVVVDRTGSMLGRQTRRAAVRAQLGCHAALDAHAPADLHDLIGPQLREAEAPQSLHMHEYVRSAFATCQKSKATNPIEPLDPGPLP